MADPAWNYDTWSEAGQGRSPSQHYETMTLADLAALPVRDICDVDCWLMLWCISSRTPDAFWLAEQWGFFFSSTMFVWIKLNPSGEGLHTGSGKTTRKNAEICWLFKRGHPTRNHADVHEVIVTPRREHSRKPDEQYPRIERFADGPYVELFARNRRIAADGTRWRSWGREVGTFPTVTA